MRNFVWKVGLLALVFFVAGGCARQTEVVKLYDDPERETNTYQRLLVVDISSNRDQQQEFENEIVDRLMRERVEAIASHTMLDASEGLRQDEIRRVSAEIGADAILVTHIASVDTKVALEEGREDIKWTCRGGDPVDYFLYEHEVVREPDSVKLAQTVIVISNLYDAGSQQRVWTIQSTCFEKATISEALLEEAIAIARQLRIDRLI